MDMSHNSEQREANTVAVATATAQGERLAVVETEIQHIRTDIADVKQDVKDVKTDVRTLVANDNRFQGGSNLIARLAPWVAVAVSIAAYASTRGA